MNMLQALSATTLLAATLHVQAADNGIVSRESPHSVDETVRRLESVLQSCGITVFARIDHSGEAEKAGLRMRPTRLLIFGNPKVGTPMMVAAPSAALDLPMKLLVAEGESGSVTVSYNAADHVRQRHGLSAEVAKPLSAIEGLVAEAIR